MHYLLFYLFTFADLSGFVSSIWSAKSRNRNEYIDVKLKTGVYQYSTIRIMKKQDSLINDLNLRNLQARNVPAKFRNISTKSNGTLFFNKLRGIKIEEGVTASFKLIDHSILSIKDTNKLQTNK